MARRKLGLPSAEPARFTISAQCRRNFRLGLRATARGCPDGIVGKALMASPSPDQTKWSLAGDYFESCNCDIVCPCLFSAKPPLTSRPTEGECHVAFFFHIDEGAYGDVKLDGLNAVVVCSSPDGPMANGNWANAAYLDERADDRQTAALGAIFSGAAGGPMAVFAPLLGESLGVKKAPITFRVDGKVRSGEIPGVASMSVEPLPSVVEGQEIWVSSAHPVNLSKLALATGRPGSTYADYGLKWDNSGRNGHYAPINWSN
jgi:hypothetical protein